MTSTTKHSFAFPHPELTPLKGKPNNSSLAVLRREAYANALAVPSHRGGGHHGHLGLLLSPEDYLTRAGTAFQPPPSPGPAPVHPAGATDGQIREVNRQYLVDVEEFDRHHALTQELKRQIIKAVPPVYLQALEDTIFGFSGVTPAAMLKHLSTKYGIYTPLNMEQNRARLSADWNVDDPIETLWARAQECKRFAAAGDDPISDVAVMNLLLLAIERTGLYTLEADQWRKMDKESWELADFQDHFERGHNLRASKLTAAGAG